ELFYNAAAFGTRVSQPAGLRAPLRSPSIASLTQVSTKPGQVHPRLFVCFVAQDVTPSRSYAYVAEESARNSHGHPCVYRRRGLRYCSVMDRGRRISTANATPR